MFGINDIKYAVNVVAYNIGQVINESNWMWPQ